MKIKAFIKTFTAVVISFFFIGALSVQATSIGVSPSALYMEVEQGTITPVVFDLSRSDAEGDLSYDVSAPQLPGVPVIDLKGQEKFVIPDGEQNIDFNFEINATEAQIGESTQTVYYYLSNTIDQGTGSVMKFGIAPKIYITVISKKMSSSDILKYSLIASGVLFAIVATGLVFYIRNKFKKTKKK
ncbi:MAG: hypothetical protein V1898_00020 [Patescibacteria group bacterium]